MPDKRLFNLNETVTLLNIDKKTILKYERDLIKFTTIYSKFGDDIFTKEELELFIICHYLITKKGYELHQLKSKIIDYAKKLTNLNYFKKFKNSGILLNQETSQAMMTDGKINHY